MGVVAFRLRFITETAFVMTTGLRTFPGSRLNAISGFMIGCVANRLRNAGATW